jgi:hypothetical protein
MRWKLLAGPAVGAPDVELTTARDRKAVWRLLQPSSLSFTLDGRHPQAVHVHALATDVHLLCDGAPLYTGRVGATTDELDAAGHAVTVETSDTRAVLARRVWRTEPGTSFSTEQADVVRAIVDHAQSAPGGDLGVSTASVAATGATAVREVKAGASLLDELSWLAQVGTDQPAEPGFDWDVSPGWSDRKLLLWYPRRGRTEPVVLDFVHTGRPRASLVAKVTRALDAATFANAVRVSAGDSSVLTPVRRTTTPGGEGLWDAAVSYSDVSDAAVLSAKASERLATLSALAPAYKVTLRRNAWGGPDHLWLGDAVRLLLRSGRLDDDVVLRVHEVEVALGESGEEDVTLTVGGAAPSVLAHLYAMERRLARVERG